ncbi:MAG: hypothetical protein AVDCRST_MAG11-4125, partial [uncultured Gemmatimonadaceae bacterium]
VHPGGQRCPPGRARRDTDHSGCSRRWHSRSSPFPLSRTSGDLDPPYRRRGRRARPRGRAARGPAHRGRPAPSRGSDRRGRRAGPRLRARRRHPLRAAAHPRAAQRLPRPDGGARVLLPGANQGL